jgi:hypothetical protein
VLPDPAPEGGNGHGGATGEVLACNLYGNPPAGWMNISKPG